MEAICLCVRWLSASLGGDRFDHLWVLEDDVGFSGRSLCDGLVRPYLEGADCDSDLISDRNLPPLHYKMPLYTAVNPERRGSGALPAPPLGE